MATFLLKKKTKYQPVRKCLNCGRDISYKRQGVKFCCKGCCMAYHEYEVLQDKGLDNLRKIYNNQEV